MAVGPLWENIRGMSKRDTFPRPILAESDLEEEGFIPFGESDSYFNV